MWRGIKRSPGVGVGLFLLAAAACTGDDPTPSSPSGTCNGSPCTTSPDGGVDAAAERSILLAVDPPLVTIAQGGTAKFHVDVQRLGVDTPIHVDVNNLPTGILAAALTLAPGATGGDIVLTAQADAQIAVTPVTLTVAAHSESGEAASKDEPKLVVRGAPGTLDATFGTGGTVVQSLGTSNDAAHCVLFDSAGRLYVGGGTGNGPVVARYTDDGKLDTTFAAPNGYVTGPALFTEACAMQPDGKIVFAGADAGDLGVVRINSDGTVDTAFGTGGRVKTDFGFTERGTGIVVLADGTLVVTGMSTNPNPSDKTTFIAWRVSSAGVSGTKSALTNVQQLDQAWSAAVAKNGDVLIGGSSAPTYMIGDVSAILVQSLNPTTLARDTVFGSGTGYLIDGVYSYGQAYEGRVRVQDDGKVIMVGYGYSNGSSTLSTFHVTRYTSTGAVDGTFGTGGHVGISVGTTSAYAHASAAQSDGKMVVVGDAVASTQEQGDFGIIRLAPDGTLDPTFHGDGKLLVPIQPGAGDSPDAVGIAPDGRIVAAGRTLKNAGNFDWAIARVWP